LQGKTELGLQRNCSGASQWDAEAKATATIYFSLDGRVCPQTEHTAVTGCMEILQLRQSLIRDYIFKIQRKLQVAATLVSSET
jgi:hypothetical protein